MAKDRFSDNPYPDVQVSDDDRRVLIDLVSGFVDDNFQEFDEFVEIDQQIVDERRWKLAKSRDNQHVYAARSRDGNFQPWQTVGGNDGKPQGKALLSVLGVGTFRGDLDDLMFGAVNPTQDNMRVKASEQAMGYNVHKRLKSISSTTSSQTDISENSSFLEAIMEESDEDEDIPLLSDLSPSEAIPMVF
uniref:Uncharacterized protein n=1 Tax=Phytophthora fragariae TaxID=53985 RepID=A0A6A3EB69_9STRA|nr:hypothetical protein PF009_g18957 [Phytophthora fragariae]